MFYRLISEPRKTRRSFYTKCSYRKQARQGARSFAESFFLIYRLSCLFAFRNELGEARDGLRTKLTLSVIEVTHPPRLLLEPRKTRHSFYTKCSYQKQARQGARGFAESFFLIYRLSCLFAFRNELGEARDGLRTKLTLSVIEVVTRSRNEA